MLSEIGQIAVRKSHLLISEQHPKKNNVAKLKNSEQTHIKF
jgi:hypothetical protein